MSSSSSSDPPLLQLDSSDDAGDNNPSQSSGSSGTLSSNLPATSNAGEVVLLASPPPVIAINNPLLHATMEQFDGDNFNINGVVHEPKKLRVDQLRKFCRDNNIKMTEPPHQSLRTSSKNVVMEEIKAKKGRMMNNEPDPWTRSESPAAAKAPSVNRYRLANVLFSDTVQPVVMGRGKCLTRQELDVGLKTDQEVFEKVALEYNKKGVDDYDEVQYSQFTIHGEKNLPSSFEMIDWKEAQKVTKDCLSNLLEARRKMDISGTHDDDIEDAAEQHGMQIGRFTPMHYVVYWNLFVEENQELFDKLKGGLIETAFNLSDGTDTAATDKKKSKKYTDIVAESLRSTAVTDEKRTDLIQEQIQIAKEQAHAVAKQANAVEKAVRSQVMRELNHDREEAKEKERKLKRKLVEHCGGRKQAMRRYKAYIQRQRIREEDKTSDDWGCGCESDSSGDSKESLMECIEHASKQLRRLDEQIEKEETEWSNIRNGGNGSGVIVDITNNNGNNSDNNSVIISSGDTVLP
jgi:hypothetical protein